MKIEKWEQAASAFMRSKRITKEMVLFINLLGKGLTQELNRDGGSISWAPDIIIESRIRRKKLMLRNSYLCTSPWRNLGTVFHCWVLSFISERLTEYWKPLNATQLIPSAKVRCGPPRYCPLRLDLWQLLYHQAPLKFNAKEPSLQRSLSWSLVENNVPLWNSKKRH